MIFVKISFFFRLQEGRYLSLLESTFLCFSGVGCKTSPRSRFSKELAVLTANPMKLLMVAREISFCTNRKNFECTGALI